MRASLLTSIYTRSWRSKRPRKFEWMKNLHGLQHDIVTSSTTIYDGSSKRLIWYKKKRLLAHPHLLVWVTSEQFLPAEVTFRIGLVSENHCMQLVLVLHNH